MTKPIVVECLWRDSACGCVRLMPVGSEPWEDLLQDLEEKGAFKFNDNLRVTFESVWDEENAND